MGNFSQLVPTYRDLASESLDGFDGRGHSLDRDVIDRAINGSAGGFGLRVPSASLTIEALQHTFIIRTHVCGRNKKFVVSATDQ